MTIIPGLEQTYKLSLLDGSGIPANWSIEFSDTIFGNRWGRDEINLVVAGRNCPSPVHSQHDRKYIWYDSNNYMIQTGRGACTSFPDTPAVDCKTQPVLNQLEYCPSVCPANKCGANSYCDCGSGNCVCNSGFTGPNCKIDTCAAAQCDPINGRCSARYLGGSLPVTRGECVCKPGTYGSKCNANPCAGNTCSGHGVCKVMSEFEYTCICNDGYDGQKCENSCVAPADITPSTPANSVCQPPCYSGIQYYPDVDIRGPDTSNQPVSTAEECGKLCEANEKCNSFVFPGWCYMKTGVDSYTALNSTVGGIRCGLVNVSIYYGPFTPT